MLCRSGAGARLITGMIQRLLEQTTVEGAIETILDDVIAMHGAEYGNVQILIGNELAIVAQRGLSAEFLKTFRRLYSYDGTACGRALRSGEVIQISDVERDPQFVAYRMDAKKAGFRSVQSAPFFAQDRRLMGVVSSHFANPHQPSEVEVEMLKAYSLPAADHVYRLLGDASLAVKAEQMSQQLYVGTLGDPGRPDLLNAQRDRTG